MKGDWKVLQKMSKDVRSKEKYKELCKENCIKSGKTIQAPSVGDWWEYLEFKYNNTMGPER